MSRYMRSPIAHGGGVAAAAAVYGGTPAGWLDLSTGINPHPVPLPDIPASAWHRLPDRDLLDAARRAARDHYASGAVLPLPVPGTQSALQLLPRLVPAGCRVAIFSPTYGEYARAFCLAGIEVDAVADPAAITAEHGLVVVVNPNNPDGRFYGRDALDGIHRSVRADGGVLVVDEAFGDMRPEGSVAPLVEAREGLIVLRSFGKFFGLAGLRLGFVIADAGTMAAFETWLGPWAVSGPALSIAAEVMKRDRQAVLEAILARKTGLDSVLKQAGLSVIGDTDLFSLVEHPDAAALHEHLCRSHILVRKFDYDESWLRFGLAPDADADGRLKRALAAFRG